MTAALVRAAACVSAAFLLGGCAPKEELVQVRRYDAGQEGRIASEIRHVFESRFDELSEQNRSHFAVRLHRVTGRREHLEAVAVDIVRRAESFREHVDSLDSEGYVTRVAERLFRSKPIETETHRARKEMFSTRKEFLFHRRILFTAHKMKAYGIHDEAPYAETHRRAVEHLAGVDFRSFLLDPEVIRCYSAQASNLVYWLRGLGAVDLEEEYIRAFRDVFMSESDETLPKHEYQGKLYGLTHLIIGDSSYYQGFVSPEKFDWVLEYFAEHIYEILAWAKADIIAEVGLCFKLCGREDDPAVTLVKEWLLQDFDPELGYIPSVAQGGDFSAAEHRNVVAYLLLTDFDRLYPGPDLTAEDLRVTAPGT